MLAQIAKVVEECYFHAPIIIWLSILMDSGRLSGMDVDPTGCILSSPLLAIAISPTLTAEWHGWMEG